MSQEPPNERAERGAGQRVALLAVRLAAGGQPPEALFQAVALELARRGHTLALWLLTADGPEPAPHGAEPAILDADWVVELQLAIGQAGGISLAWAERLEDESAGGLAWVIEAFGRIDTAVAWGAAAAGRLAAALSGARDPARPKRAICLGAGQNGGLPNLRGIQVVPYVAPAGPEPGALARAAAEIAALVEA